MKIQKTSTPETRKLNCLVYGESGAGKTTFAGTAIGRFKPIIISAESGLLSLNRLGEFDYIEIQKFEDIDEARQFLRFSKHGYDTIIIDSLTEIQHVAMDKILRDQKIETAKIQDYGTLGQRMTTMIRDFRDMNLNLIATALADSKDNEESGIPRVGPLMMGKIKETLPAYFDEVFYLHTRTTKGEDGKPVVKRLLQTQGTDRVVAKDRSGMLAPLVEPDFCTVFDMIFNQPKKEK